MTPIEQERQEYAQKRGELLDLLAEIIGRGLPRSLADHVHAVAIVRAWMGERARIGAGGDPS